jgi:hypothetical protein
LPSRERIHWLLKALGKPTPAASRKDVDDVNGDAFNGDGDELLDIDGAQGKGFGEPL